ncbi:hypothetical protein [Streptomyces alboflavus]|uniref:hypothetical protein n=1 Tax=Streptomyces alboflavus TaxID=67267 RepID=UPI000F658F09|nr:hypothetical protein [Streptomyces alboflavus]
MLGGPHDGARHQLDLIQAEAKRHWVTIHIAFDLVHALEKLWAASRCFHAPADPATEDWIAIKAPRILRGRAQQAAAEIRAQADQRKLSGDQRTAADEACQYLSNNADFVHCDRALAAGWPIASGVIEGAARHLIADRLDITGSRWRVPCAEALLILRAVISNDDFSAYWQYHLKQENGRLYPPIDQGKYTLTA